MSKPEEPTDKVPVGTTWCAEDVRTHYGDRVEHMTDEEILEGLRNLHKYFDEKLVESGWEVIDFCFDIKEGGI